MRYAAAVWLLIVMGWGPDVLADCVIDYTPRSAEEAQIVALEKEWCEAALHRDRARLAAVFADDVSWVTDVGYRDKNQVIHRYTDEVEEQSMHFRDIRIRVLQDVAVVQSHIHVRKIVDGRLIEDDHAAMDVLSRRGDRWLVVAE